MNGNVSISIIGGADGPTFIFWAGTLRNGISTGMIIIGFAAVVLSLSLYLTPGNSTVKSPCPPENAAAVEPKSML